MDRISSIPEAPSAEFVEHTEFQADERRKFESRLQPTPETAQFRQEMADPLLVKDEFTGLNFGVYALNRDKTGKPLVINKAWSVAAGVEPGRSDVKAYATHLDRPLFVIDMEATGLTDVPEREQRKELSFVRIAAAHLRVLDMLGVEEFDAAGYSMGGVVAAKMAALVGDRVQNLITISTVSFEKMKKRELGWGFAVTEGRAQKRYLKAASAAVQAEAQGGFLGSREALPTLIKLAELMTEPALADIAMELNPHTRWTDIVGSKEAVTDWRQHLKRVRERNSIFPRSAAIHILGSESHSWGVHKNAVAELATSTIMRTDAKSKTTS